MTTHSTTHQIRGASGFAGVAALVWIAVGCVTNQFSGDRTYYSGVTAHRGDSTDQPENTISAFERAIELGADWVECDVFKTGDGRLVVIHDATTGRVADRNLSVTESTYAELRTLDVAHGYRQATGMTLVTAPPARIPLLEDVIRLIKTQKRSRLSIQPKQDIVDEVMALVRSLNAEPWIGLNEGNLERLQRAQELAPTVMIFYDTDGQDTARHVAEARRHAFESIVMYHKNVTREDVDLVHAAGLEAGAWTVNSLDEMRRLLDLGIDRIYTDAPYDLMMLKKQRGLIPSDADRD